MKQELAKPKSKLRLREVNRFKFLGHLSKALNIMKSTFSFLKTKNLGAFNNKALPLSQTSLQSYIINGLALPDFHV